MKLTINDLASLPGEIRSKFGNRLAWVGSTLLLDIYLDAKEDESQKAVEEALYLCSYAGWRTHESRELNANVVVGLRGEGEDDVDIKAEDIQLLPEAIEMGITAQETALTAQDNHLMNIMQAARIREFASTPRGKAMMKLMDEAFEKGAPTKHRRRFTEKAADKLTKKLGLKFFDLVKGYEATRIRANAKAAQQAAQGNVYGQRSEERVAAEATQKVLALHNMVQGIKAREESKAA